MENRAQKTMTVTGILQHLKDGMTRKDIAAFYGITMTEMKIHFQHPLLKNKKTIKIPTLVYTLIDDVNELPTTEPTKIEEIEVVAEEVVVEKEVEVVEPVGKKGFGEKFLAMVADTEPEPEEVVETEEEIEAVEIAKATWD